MARAKERGREGEREKTGKRRDALNAKAFDVKGGKVERRGIGYIIAEVEDSMEADARRKD